MNQRMPTNLTGQMAETWDSLFAQADSNGVVTVPAGEVVANLETLAAVGGCTVEDQPDGSKKVTLTFTDAPVEAPVLDTSQVSAATKKTEFAAGEGENREVR